MEEKHVKKVTLEIPAEFSTGEIMSTVMDSLAEFVGNRGDGNARAYVEKRYNSDTTTWMSAKRMEEKVQEVERRIRIARALRHNIQIVEAVQDPYEHDRWVLVPSDHALIGAPEGSLSCEVVPGSEISQACSHGLAISAQTRVPVAFKFNGVMVVARVGDSIDALVDSWSKDLRERSKTSR